MQTPTIFVFEKFGIAQVFGLSLTFVEKVQT